MSTVKSVTATRSIRSRTIANRPARADERRGAIRLGAAGAHRPSRMFEFDKQRGDLRADRQRAALPLVDVCAGSNTASSRVGALQGPHGTSKREHVGPGRRVPADIPAPQSTAHSPASAAPLRTAGARAAARAQSRSRWSPPREASRQAIEAPAVEKSSSRSSVLRHFERAGGLTKRSATNGVTKILGNSGNDRTIEIDTGCVWVDRSRLLGPMTMSRVTDTHYGSVGPVTLLVWVGGADVGPIPESGVRPGADISESTAEVQRPSQLQVPIEVRCRRQRKVVLRKSACQQVRAGGPGEARTGE